MQYLYTICDNCSQNNIKCSSFRKKDPNYSHYTYPKFAPKRQTQLALVLKKLPNQQSGSFLCVPITRHFLLKNEFLFNILEKKEIVTENNK